MGNKNIKNLYFEIFLFNNILCYINNLFCLSAKETIIIREKEKPKRISLGIQEVNQMSQRNRNGSRKRPTCRHLHPHATKKIKQRTMPILYKC